MKRLLVCLTFILLLSSVAHAEESKYAQAIRLGQEQHKYVFLLFTSNNCSYCDQLKQYTFRDKLVSNTLKQYVYLEVNVSTDRTNLASRFRSGYQGHPFSKRWRGQVPAYFLVNPSTYQCVGQDLGYQKSHEFLQWLREIKNQGHK